jgi:uncharacterized membrane protein YfcA
VSAIDVAAGLAVLAGAMLQSAIGFGFSLICAPLVFAATTPEQAVGLLMLLGVEVNVLTLVGERRRPRPLVRAVATVLAWALPGLALGVVILRAVDKTTIQIALTIAVFASLAIQRWARRHEATRPAAGWAAPAAGVAAGALTTSTTTAGPPLILLLRGRGTSALQIRDTLTACFLGLGLLGAAALAVSDTSAAVPDAGALAVLVPLVVAGHVAGRPVFRRLSEGAYEPVLTAVLVISAVGALVVALV